MNTTAQAPEREAALSRYATPMVAWALAFGSSIGWGSFVMPGTTFLPVAGPLGSALGIAVGAAVMLVVGVSYHFLINHYPDAGGAFTYAKKVFGYDHGFLCAWFLSITYIAVIWANATALPLIARNLLGSAFQFGFSYEIAGYQVYFGEILLAVSALFIAALVCLRSRVAGVVQIAMAFVLIIGVGVCFIAVGQQHPVAQTLSDAGSLSASQLGFGFLNVVALAPWAFIGFESISHSASEFRFSPKKSLTIMIVAVASAAIGYILLVIIAASVQPSGYDGWAPYIANLGSFSGIEGLPTFFAIQSCLGDAGSVIIGLAAIGGIATGLVGSLVAASRLLYAMSLDGLMPAWFSKISPQGVPAHAILAILGVSVLVPFIGRAATTWIVDVTTVGAAIAYAYTSACALKVARAEGQRTYTVFAVLGIVASALFMCAFLIPNILEISTLSAESYLILAAWSVLGFVFFRMFYKKDEGRQLGRSPIAWVVLLALILFTSLVWIQQTTGAATEQTAVELQQAYDRANAAQAQGADGGPDMDAAIVHHMKQIDDKIWMDNLVQMLLIVITLVFMFDIYNIMQKRREQAEVEKARAEESSRAKTSFLSNMSHEIRTPMNAIIGLDNIALKDPDLSPRTREQLEKIGGSAKHLLGLINDILDMSRIESGRMSLKNEEFAFRDFLEQINVIINGQCEDKGLDFECQIVGQTSDYYVGDDMKLKQVLINILGNSVKFTEAPGTVTFAVEQLQRFEGMCTLQFTMADTGVGMDADYLPKIFEAFTQEDDTSTSSYGGSGLGMAITKNIVDMMNGDIRVESEKGVGTTFVVTVTLKASARSNQGEGPQMLPADLRALVVDDDAVACEHAVLVLGDIGISAESCTHATEALDRIRTCCDRGEPIDLVLTDYRMPDIDGIQLTRDIKRIGGEGVKVLMLTGYSFDDVTDEALQAGADALMNKPLFTDTLLRELRALFVAAPSVGAADTADGPSAGDEAEDAGEQGATAGEQLAPEIADGIYEEGSLAGRRILLAEDIQINADIMIDLLDMEDIQAEHGENGQIVVDMFAASAPDYYDAVLMDVRMPVMDGLTAASTIRKLDRPDAKTVPIIALTANAFDEDVQRSLQAGMDAHLSKPVEPDRLYGTLAKLIARREQR